MTIIMHKSHGAEPVTRSSMPGWGITADLTPPELRTRRSLVVLRRAMGVALIVIIVLCAGGYWLSRQANDAAQNRLNAATTQSAGIQAMIDKHSGVTRVKAATAALNAQLATLFAQDVDIPKIVAQLADASGDVDITSISVTTTSAAQDSATAATNAGTVTMSGTSRRLVAVANFVDALQRIPGVTNIIPSTNNAGGSWAITLQLTQSLLTHRFATPSSTSSSTSSSTATGGN